jgi:hypothetical protein
MDCNITAHDGLQHAADSTAQQHDGLQHAADTKCYCVYNKRYCQWLHCNCLQKNQQVLYIIKITLWGGWSGVRILAGTRNFSPLQTIHTEYRVHTASHLMGKLGSFPGSGQSMRLTTNHPMMTLRMSGIISPIPLYAFMACTGTTSTLQNYANKLTNKQMN